MFAGVDKLGGGVVGNAITAPHNAVITMGESAATARCMHWWFIFSENVIIFQKGVCVHKRVQALLTHAHVITQD